ncbi:glycosyltransferase [Actinomadura scrupuli]|uniref:glycosyltransferase n=1 Tax=Actinomadura scrupuli TaxID=559629 RepID=UPI003D99AD53
MSRIRRAAMPSLAEMGVVPFHDPGARRFLFVVPPLPGHVEPTVALGAELARRGHQVAWAGHPGSVTPLLEPTARLFPTRDKGFASRLARARDARLRLRGPAALRFLWEDFLIPLGHGMVPGIEAAVQEFRPDVIVSDQRTPAGAVVALRNGVTWATSACTSAAFGPALPGLPKADEWVTAQLAAFQRAHGLEEPVDLRFSGHLVLGFSAAGLVGEPGRFPGRVVFAGPVPGPPAADDFPWEWLEASVPTVLVSLGVPYGPAEARFAGIAVDALSGLGLRAVFVAPPGVLDPPPHVLVRQRVPLPRLLPHLSAVVTHGDHDTVCETLAHGLPLVIAPVRDEEPVLAHQVAEAGAGVTVRFARVRTDELRKALTAVLSDQTYRSAARRVQSSFAAAGGLTEAADRLEKPA